MSKPNLVLFAQDVARKCLMAPPSSVREINAPFLSKLYDKICQPFLEDPPILPDLTVQPREHVAAILDSLSCNFLNLDLDPLLRVGDILAGDEKALLFILRIFDNLYNCLAQPDQPTKAEKSVTKPASSQARTAGPKYMGRRINDLRSASVIYSPRTAALRRLRRSRTVQEPIRANPSPKSRTADQEAGKPPVEELEKEKRRADSILHRYRSAVETRRARIAVEAAKASIRNKTIHQRHVAALAKKTKEDLLRKATSNDLKLAYVKERARKALLEQIMDDSAFGIQDPRRLRLLAELGSHRSILDVSGPSSSDLLRERTEKTKEMRSLLADLPSNLFC